MGERTDGDKLGKLGVMVTLGASEYEIRPLVIAQSRAWRKQAAEVLDSLGAMSDLDLERAGDMISAARVFLTQTIDTLFDLLFAYAPELPRDEIENTATDEQAVTALIEVFKLAFPFQKLLTFQSPNGAPGGNRKQRRSMAKAQSTKR